MSLPSSIRPVATTCPIPDCGADPERGTINGGAPMLCGGYGHPDPRCMANWAASDPEDHESYEEYLRDPLATPYLRRPAVG